MYTFHFLFLQKSGDTAVLHYTANMFLHVTCRPALHSAAAHQTWMQVPLHQLRCLLRKCKQPKWIKQDNKTIFCNNQKWQSYFLNSVFMLISGWFFFSWFYWNASTNQENLALSSVLRQLSKHHGICFKQLRKKMCFGDSVLVKGQS